MKQESKLANIINQYREYTTDKIYAIECLANSARILMGYEPRVYNDVTRAKITYDISKLFPKD